MSLSLKRQQLVPKLSSWETYLCFQTCSPSLWWGKLWRLDSENGILLGGIWSL